MFTNSTMFWANTQVYDNCLLMNYKLKEIWKVGKLQIFSENQIGVVAKDLVNNSQLEKEPA